MFKSKHQFISNYSVVTGLYLSNTCLIFSDFTKTPQNGKVLKGSDFSLFQVKSKQLSQNRDIVNNFAPEWHSRGQRFDPAYLHQEARECKSIENTTFSMLLLFSFLEVCPSTDRFQKQKAHTRRKQSTKPLIRRKEGCIKWQTSEKTRGTGNTGSVSKGEGIGTGVHSPA